MSCPPARRVVRTVKAEVARDIARKIETRSREERWNPQKAAAAARRARRESDRSTNFQVLGAVLLAIGGNWLLAEVGLFSLGWPGLLAVALMTLGVGLIGTAKAGRTAPMVFIGVALTVALAISSGVSGPFRGPSFADETHTPTSLSDLRTSYEGDVGDMTLDLSGLEFDGASRKVSASIRVGDLTVLFPEGVAVSIDAEVGALGDIDLLGQKEDGFGPDHTYKSSGFDAAASRLELDLDVGGFGDIVVERA